jgi:hypothetical protein
MLSDQELAELKERCNYAHAHGFQIGLAECYVDELGGAGDDAPDGVTPNSPAHLLSLIEYAEKNKKKAPVREPKVSKPPPPGKEPAKKQEPVEVKKPELQEPPPVQTPAATSVSDDPKLEVKTEEAGSDDLPPV